MRLLLYTARRLLLLIPVLFGVTVVTFLVVRVLPGDPVRTVVPETATAEDIEAARARLGLDRPLHEQYGDFVTGFVRGDFGRSIQTGGSVSEELARRLGPTLELVLLAIGIALALAVVFGVLAAVRAGRPSDHVTRLLALAGNSMPEFWLGLVLILVFYAMLGWAPPPSGRLATGLELQFITGFATVDAILTGNGPALRSALAHLALPVATLTVAVTAPLLRSVRAAALEVLNSDGFRCAEVHGLRRGVLLGRYTLRETLTRLPTLAALVVGYLLGGAVLVEFVFSWQGVGQWALRGLLLRDYPVIQAFVAVTATFYLIVFLVADLLQAALDPRVKL